MMKVFLVNADMRTPDNIDFGLDYFAFVKCDAVPCGEYNYTIKSGESADNADTINSSTKVITLNTGDYKAAVMAHFDATVRTINPNVDKVTITEITL